MLTNLGSFYIHQCFPPLEARFVDLSLFTKLELIAYEVFHRAVRSSRRYSAIVTVIDYEYLEKKGLVFRAGAAFELFGFFGFQGSSRYNGNYESIVWGAIERKAIIAVLKVEDLYDFLATKHTSLSNVLSLPIFEKAEKSWKYTSLLYRTWVPLTQATGHCVGHFLGLFKGLTDEYVEFIADDIRKAWMFRASLCRNEDDDYDDEKHPGREEPECGLEAYFLGVWYGFSEFPVQHSTRELSLPFVEAPSSPDLLEQDSSPQGGDNFSDDSFLEQACNSTHKSGPSTFQSPIPTDSQEQELAFTNDEGQERTSLGYGESLAQECILHARCHTEDCTFRVSEIAQLHIALKTGQVYRWTGEDEDEFMSRRKNIDSILKHQE